MSLLTPEMRAAVGRSLPPVTAEVTRREIRKYAVATGQRLVRYLRGDEAPPLFLYGLFREIAPLETLSPDGRQDEAGLIPELPLRRVMAGGVDATYCRRVYPGDTLVCTRTLVDLFEKQGAQGPLIFAVIENRVETVQGEPVMTERLTRIAR